MGGLRIGQVAERAGVATPTIRYYESIGLLTPPARSTVGYRHYSAGTVDELRFIKKAQALGFSLEEIGEILTLIRAGKPACSHVLALARRHLTAADERLRQLRRFRKRLAAEVARWDGKKTPTCTGLCQIIVDAQPDAIEGVNPQLGPHRRRTRAPKERSRRGG